MLHCPSRWGTGRLASAWSALRLASRQRLQTLLVRLGCRLGLIQWLVCSFLYYVVGCCWLLLVFGGYFFFDFSSALAFWRAACEARHCRVSVSGAGGKLNLMPACFIRHCSVRFWTAGAAASSEAVAIVAAGVFAADLFFL